MSTEDKPKKLELLPPSKTMNIIYAKGPDGTRGFTLGRGKGLTGALPIPPQPRGSAPPPAAPEPAAAAAPATLPSAATSGGNWREPPEGEKVRKQAAQVVPPGANPAAQGAMSWATMAAPKPSGVLGADDVADGLPDGYHSEDYDDADEDLRAGMAGLAVPASPLTSALRALDSRETRGGGAGGGSGKGSPKPPAPSGPAGGGLTLPASTTASAPLGVRSGRAVQQAERRSGERRSGEAQAQQQQAQQQQAQQQQAQLQQAQQGTPGSSSPLPPTPARTAAALSPGVAAVSLPQGASQGMWGPLGPQDNSGAGW